MAVLHIISVISLSLAFVSALCILGYVIRHPQSMKIMNVVWPLTGLWAGLCGLWAFFSFGRPKQMAMKMDDSGDDMAGMGHDMKHNMNDMSMGSDLRFWQKIALSTLHCGAGCTLADLIGEFAGPLFLPAIGLVGIGWQWTLDYILALLIGALFQYAAIRPMMPQMSGGKVLAKAFKIDFLSLTGWQVGMYSCSYIFLFVLMPYPLSHNSWSFWFVMQLAMVTGFFFSYPVNWFLVKKGIKASM